MEYILRTEKLCKNYGRSRALNGLDMNVPKGAIYGFVGRNGAGKTTLIRMICSLQYPSSGTFELYGVKNTDPKFGKAAFARSSTICAAVVCVTANRSLFWVSAKNICVALSVLS